MRKKDTKNSVSLVAEVIDAPNTRIVDGVKLLCLRVRTYEAWVDPAGKDRELYEDHKVYCKGDLAAECEIHIRRGLFVSVEGMIKSRVWRDLDGGISSEHYIVANSIRIWN